MGHVERSGPEHNYNQTLRRQWRFFCRYCGGDLTYDGIHQVDLARWLCGLKYPKTVFSNGARYDRNGAAETPDTQLAVLEFDDLMMSFEVSLNTPYMIKADDGVRNGDIYPYWPQNTERIEIYGSHGLMYVGRMGAGWQVYVRQKNRQPVIRDQMHGRFPDKEHQQNFIECVRSRNRPNADIEEGHLSMLLVHYAMISYRLGANGSRSTRRPSRFPATGAPWNCLRASIASPGWSKTTCSGRASPSKRGEHDEGEAKLLTLAGIAPPPKE